jgi:hypothetical protein
MNIKIVTMSSGIVTIVIDNGLTNVYPVLAIGAGNLDGLKSLSACKDGMCSLLVDIECGDLGGSLCLQALILWSERVESARGTSACLTEDG